MVGFPLLLIPVAIYNIIVFLMPGVSFAEPIVKLTLVSGTEWPVTLSDILLALGILLLLCEVIKGARPGAKYLTDHLLSLVVFGCAAAEFVMWPRFGSSTYFLLTLLALTDFLSGIALRARRGRAVAPAALVPRESVSKPEPPVSEPRFEPAPTPAPVPAPAPSMPAATSVAESVLLDHPEPSLAQPAVTPSAASPEVPSPELQPGSGSPPTPEEPPR
ncbi:hypothetical protein [Bradyrhizobium canariense]|nr:hypothetical protein [Bradyrhizobium canariense]